MIRIDMICQNTRHPDKRRRHQGRASCEVADCRFETEGPAPIYKLATLLWLHGYGGAAFEVCDDVSPFGKPGGLAMTGRVRSWARLVKAKVTFDRRAKPEPQFTEEQRIAVGKAAGMVTDLGQKAQARGGQRAVCATSPSDDPEYPQKEDGASKRVVTAHTLEAA